MKPEANAKQDPKAWNAGYQAGLTGKAPRTPPGVDGLAFQSGVIEGRADRLKKPEEQRNQPIRRIR